MRRPRSTGAREVTREIVAAGVLAGVVLLAAAFLLTRGAGLGIALAIAAAPAALAVGRRYAMVVFAVVLVVRPLVDGAGMPMVTTALGLGMVALAAVLAVYDARVLLALGLAALPVLAATVQAYPTYGMVAVDQASKVLSGVSAALVVLFAPGSWSRAKAARLVQVAVAVPAAVALIQAVTGTGRAIGENLVARSTGTISQADPAGFIFAIGALASFVLLVEDRRRWLDTLAVAFFAGAVVTTGTIGGMIALVVFLFSYVALVYGPISRQFGGIVVGMAVLVGGALLTPVGQGRLAEYSPAATPSTQGNSLVWRLDAWTKVIAAWRTDPIAGLGFGSAQVGGVLGDYIPHNEYLRVLLENGIIGWLIMLSTALAYLLAMIWARRQGASSRNAAMAGAITVGTAINALADNTLMVIPTVYLVATFLATALRQAMAEARAAAVSTTESWDYDRKGRVAELPTRQLPVVRAEMLFEQGGRT